MSTLVTGGAGFVGASLVRALEARGEAVRVADSGVAAGFGYLDGTRAERVAIDLAAPAAPLEPLLDEVDDVVHLAARTGIPASIADPLADLAANVSATVSLLDLARRRGVRRFVLASSNAAVGRMTGAAREDVLAAPVTPYGAAKLATEAYAHAFHASYGLAAVCLRFSNAYGPFSLHKGSVIPVFIRTLLGGGPLEVEGDGLQTRDFIHVSDVVAAVLAALDAPADEVAGEVFQVGTGEETTIRAVAERLISTHGAGTIAWRPSRPGEVGRNVSDITKARRRLGWSPRVTLDEGLEDTLAWFRVAAPRGIGRT